MAHEKSYFPPTRPQTTTTSRHLTVLPLLGVILLLVSWPNLSLANPYPRPLFEPTKQLIKNAIAAAAPLLDVFQVAVPVLTPLSTPPLQSNDSALPPSDSASCVAQQTLMDYSFGNSYGQPFVGSYAPPADCAFNRVTFNLTVTSAGRQFDRLGIVYFGSTEIWRTSTAEPTSTGIIWTYTKDLSHLLALFKEPQTLIFDLGNLIDDTYTAPFNATLVATFFTSPGASDAADLILPVSGGNGSANQASVFSVPPQIASSALTLPQNVNKAVVSISATGQIGEEFWYTNALSSLTETFNASGVELLPYGPFREVQLYIDGTLAGVVWPFPIIFTGGIVPGFWRPIVGIDAFDLGEDEIDVSPFLGVLCDGLPHTFEIRVAGIREDGEGGGSVESPVGSYWLVTGKLFLWLDGEGSVTTGAAPVVDAPAPVVGLSSSVGMAENGTNTTLSYSVDVSRKFSVSGVIVTANGSATAGWSQDLTYSNTNDLSNGGFTQVTTQMTSGSDFAPARPYARRISYPLTVNSTFSEDDAAGSLSISGELQRGQDIFVAGSPVFPSGIESYNANGEFQGSQLSTTQNGSAFYLRSPSLNVSSGTMGQELTFDGVRVDGFEVFPSVTESERIYERNVVAVNGTVTEDSETLEGVAAPGSGFGAAEVEAEMMDVVAAPNAMGVLGRGRGRLGVGLPP